MARRSDRPTDDCNEIAPSLGLLDPDDRWYPEPGEASSLGIRREQTPKPRDGSWADDDPEPAIVLTPRQAARLAVYEYAAAWRRIRRAKGGAAAAARGPAIAG